MGQLRQLLERLRPADARTFVENLLPVSPVRAPWTQPGLLRRDGATVVAASVLCGAVSADSPNFICDSDDYFHGAQYDVDYSDYSDYDEPDELDCYSDVLTQLIIMHRLIWNLCMTCMDQITVGSIVSCGMRSDHMDIMHQRTVSFPMA